ncbi:hypothetical protein F2Q70_00033061 [Brassica cretica]|uniref:Uncharacterized protein n=1 Tax=Brassica cretica TaxID=69181 RepID=A0A8S9FKH2_BRACR|nr:hypothetical protein F2Q70_00033061 [Brassica cretica]
MKDLDATGASENTRRVFGKNGRQQNKKKEKSVGVPRRPVARPRARRRRWFTFFRLSQGSPLWASIYRFPRHADGSGLGFCVKEGSACTVLPTAAMLFSLDPW